MIRCDACKGQKQVAQLGMMVFKDCPVCDGLGSVKKESEKIASNLQEKVISIKRKRKSNGKKIEATKNP